LLEKAMMPSILGEEVLMVQLQRLESFLKPLILLYQLFVID